jgi:hypothetical protein
VREAKRRETKQPASRPLSENKTRELVERIANLDAHQNERCDHQIEAEMHGSLEPNIPCGRAEIEAAGRTANSVRVGDVVEMIFWAAFDSTSMIFAGRRGCDADAILFGNDFNACALEMSCVKA